MAHLKNFSPYDPDALPPVIVRYLTAQTELSTRPAAAAEFAANARVVDEGIEYVGIEAIRGWLAGAASEYTYTTTFIGQDSGDENHWVILARLEGNFPGGVADLRFRATIEEDSILDLVIAP